jgi:hypothetical protein
MNALLVMSDPARPGTLVDLYRLFSGSDAWKQWRAKAMADPDLARWVEHVLPRTDYTRVGSDGIALGGYLSSKLEEFVFDPRVRGVFGQRHSTFDFRSAIADRKIVLVNLSKGMLGARLSRFFGMVVLAKLQVACAERVRIPRASRHPIFVYVDEFQAVATQTFVEMLSEGRKFGLGLVLANQFTTQLQDDGIINAVFGNVGSLVVFRVGRADADRLAPQVGPEFSADDLRELPNWNAVVRMQVDGQGQPPFSMRTLPPGPAGDPKLAWAAVERSRQLYGRPPEVDIDVSSAHSRDDAAENVTLLEEDLYSDLFHFGEDCEAGEGTEDTADSNCPRVAVDDE